MELRVNDYVRTEYGIAKYISDEVTKDGVYYVVDKDIMTCNVEGWKNCLSGSKEIVKSSPNIIDLIEVGDYVNGYRVLNVLDFNDNSKMLSLEKIYDSKITNEDIKSIVTKEQFKNMEYEVK